MQTLPSSNEHELWLTTPAVAVGVFNAHRARGRHDTLETHYCFGITESSYDVEVAGRGRALVGPDVLRLHRPGDHIHARFPGGRSRGTWFVADQEWIAGAAPNGDIATLYASPFVRPPLPVMAAIRTYFARVRGSKDAFYAEEGAVAILGEVATIENQYAPLLVGKSMIVRDAEALLAERFATPLRLRDIAADLGVSAAHLARTYRSVTGNRLHAQLSRLRICEAMKHLADGRQDITALALDLGYSSHSHFTSDFRRLVGRTPRDFRLGSKI